MSMRELMHRITPNLSVRKDEDPFVTLQGEINRLFDSFFGASHMPAWFGRQNMEPAVDVVESDKAYKVKVELPGIDPKDVEVSVNDRYLTIRGEKKEEKEEKKENFVRRESSYGSFQRVLALPETAEGGKVNATFKNGVLTVELPKKAEAVAQSRKVEIRQAA